jgi:uncharacterized repeat protein (TIGR03803 family)
MRSTGIPLLFPAVLAVLLTTAACAQTFSAVYNFGSKGGDPTSPQYSGILAQGRDGNIYGVAPTGGASGAGGAFKLTPAGKMTVLHSFVGSDGQSPQSGLTLGTDGNFYGTTVQGGTSIGGTIFKVTPSGVLTTLYNFTLGTDGGQPYAPPVQGNDGNFYGTTTNGGPSGAGTVYKITPAGTFTPLYQFDITHGTSPFSPLVLGTDGNFYGTAGSGGANGDGVVFRITSAGKLTVLHSFDNTHGRGPFSPVVQGTDGNFYGTTLTGGTHNSGVVFKMTPAGALTVIHNMNGTTEGYGPYAGLVQATDGNFYGVNANGGTASAGCPSGCGVLFKVTPTGTFTVLHNFDGATGNTPFVSPFQHTNGLVYGDTEQGGSGNVSPCSTGSCGLVYSWKQGVPAFVRPVTYSGKVGKVIEFLGGGFTGTTAVSFNGTPATFTVASATYMTATIPSGATTGSVTVTTPGGVLTSNKKFRVTPQLTSFTPSTGPVGTVVTITGVSLTQATKVTFGGVAATAFTVNSDTQVTVTVPTGAVTGKIVITTPGGTASSTTNFTLT